MIARAPERQETMRFPLARLLAVGLVSLPGLVGVPRAAAEPPAAASPAPSPSPSPSPTAEDRAREVEREDLEEDAPGAVEEEPPAAPSPELVGPPVPVETPADRNTRPSARARAWSCA